MSKILIYGDVHGNLPAFEAMLKHVGVCDGYICLGDLVNYGPWSNECVELACSLRNSVMLMGNHEEDFIAGQYSGESKLVKMFFEKTYSDFTRFDEIKKFKQMHRMNDYVLTHTINNQYIYPDTSIVLDNNYVIGHSHHQFIYRNREFILYNAGSVGQNRSYINEINYLIYNQNLAHFKLGSFLYNVNLFIKELSDRGYPKDCIDYYVKKEII